MTTTADIHEQRSARSRRAPMNFVCAVVAILLVNAPAHAQSRTQNAGADQGERTQVSRSAPSSASGTRRYASLPLEAGDSSVTRAWYIVERASADFGLVSPGDSATLDGALVIRVFSDRDWTLKLAPRTTTVSAGTLSSPIPASRLALRSNSTHWEPLREGIPRVIARGEATGGAGELVILDLKLDLDGRDPVGYFGAELELTLDPL